VAGALAAAVYYVVPNLSALDVKNEVVHGLAVSWTGLGTAVAATIAYVGFVLTVAAAVFARRDFK
jgi:hypothetical protein